MQPPAGEPLRVGLFLLLLLSVDLVFIGMHIVHSLSPWLGDRMYSLETDRGYAECFQYAQNFWVVLMLGTHWWRSRERIVAAWMLVFAWLLCDDALQIHEHGGYAIARMLGLSGMFGLRAQDLGELALCATVGFTVLGFIALLYRRSSPDSRRATMNLALLLGVLVFFGVFMDMLHARFGSESAPLALGVIEDGGEMLAMSATCAYVLRLAECRGRVAAPL